MATRMLSRNVAEIPSLDPNVYRVLTTVAFTATATSLDSLNTEDEFNERPIGDPGAGIPIPWYSERLASETTIGGTITFNIWAFKDATFTGRLRARLYKVTAGGSNVASLIATADAASDLTTASTAYTFTATPTPTTVVAGERFILRLSVLPVLGSFGTGNATVEYNEETSGVAGYTWVEFTETVPFTPNINVVHLRRTNVNGIGNFYDMLPTLGASPFTTADTATADGATEIPWTRTPTNAARVVEITAAAIASTSNVNTYASASYTPVANRLYLLAVAHSDAAPETTVPTVTTTNGLAFVQVGSSMPFGTIASPGQRLTLFRAMKASGLSAGTHTVTLGDNGTGCAAILAEVTGVVTTGTDGADAVRNTSTNNADASANPSITMGSFADATNGTFACFAANTQTAPTEALGFAALSYQDYATPAVGIFAEWSIANKSTASCTLASSAWAGIAVELVDTPGDSTLVEWISGRVQAPGFNFLTASGFIWCVATGANFAANARLRVRLFRRQPNGTETLCYEKSVTAEFQNVPIQHALSAGTITPLAFAEDDRFVCRPYIYNNGTMVGGYVVSLDYDHNALDVNGNSTVRFLEGPTFKAEGDPARSMISPSGGALTGLSNGQ